MSYHILHISEYGCKLSKERGLLVCKKDGAVLGKIAIEDLRAVVIVAGGVSISGEVFFKHIGERRNNTALQKLQARRDKRSELQNIRRPRSSQPVRRQ